MTHRIDTSEAARALNAKRKTHGGKPKRLLPCSHCGQLLGVRERRQHGDKAARQEQAESMRHRRAAKRLENKC